MINIPNVFRSTPSQKTLTKNLPGQQAVSKGQPVDDYKNIDRRQTADRRKKRHDDPVLDSRAQKRREDDGIEHIDVDA